MEVLLRSDGEAVAFGRNSEGQCNIPFVRSLVVQKERERERSSTCRLGISWHKYGTHEIGEILPKDCGMCQDFELTEPRPATIQGQAKARRRYIEHRGSR